MIVNRYLPHNFLAEKIVLSCLLINPKLIGITLNSINVDFFYFKNHQEIYKAIVFMYKNKMPIDIITLVTFLQDNGILYKIGGIVVIVELISEIPNLTYFEEYITLIKDKFVRRSLITLGYEIINSSYITNIPVEEVINIFESKIFDLKDYKKNQKIFSSSELVNLIFFDLKKKSLKPELPGILSGFYELDAITQGFQKSDLIIVAGRPSMGKTALSLNIGLNIVKNSKFSVLFFSLEMSKEQIMYRILTTESNINQIKLKTGKLNKEDWIKLNKTVKSIANWSFFIDDSSNLSIEDIRSKLKTVYFEQKQISLIIIDYLQLMQDSSRKNENRVQELSKITRSLKILAREFNIPIIALSQLSRNIENRIDKKPILSDLRESGSIEQDADVILMLYKNKYDNINFQESNIIDLIIAKHRNGPLGTIKLEFEQDRTKFFNISKIDKDC